MQPVEVNTWEKLGYKDLGEWIGTKTDEMGRFLKSKRNNNGDYDLDGDQVEIVKGWNKSLEDANKRFEQLKEVEQIAKNTADAQKSLNQPVINVPFQSGNTQGNSNVNVQTTKSLGEMFTESRTYKSVGSHNDMIQYSVTLDDVDFTRHIKTTMTTSAGFSAPNPRTDIFVDFALRRPMVGDLVPTDPTNLSSIKYMEETTFTNNAAGVTENNAKPESALAGTERTVPVEVIATYIPVTNQQLDDVPGIQGYINRRLSTMVLLTEENYLLNGTGTPPQITGFLVKSGTNTQARGADSNVDCIFKGMQSVRTTGFAEPDGIVVHPDNWTTIRLMKTADGIYIWGSPSEQGPERIFGKPVVVTTAMTANTGLVGDFGLYSHISRKMGLTVIVGMINDDLVKNKRTILAELRESLEIYRAAAFTKCTGLN